MPNAHLPPSVTSRRRHDRLVSGFVTLVAAFVFGGEVMGALGYW